MRIRRLLLTSCMLILGFLIVAPSFALQSSPLECTKNNTKHFSQTNHNVCGQFLEFLNSRGGVELFGYPITKAFIENGRVVQYFQRVRMEYHPELSPAYQVQLGLLGDFLAPEANKARINDSEKPKSNDPERRYFRETGHTVQFGFLEFFNDSGGVDIFGYPVTEFFLENGRVVQYFQRAKMEWNPNQGGIVLHLLGEMWVDQHRHLQSMQGPELALESSSVAPVPSVSAVYASASIRDAFTGREGNQTVWVYVTDQNGQPVEGAEVTLIALFVPGARTLPMVPTDELGHTQISFNLPNLTPGQLVILEAKVRYAELATQARTFFLAWW